MWFVAGNLLATLMASVGPVYYGNFFGDAEIYAAMLDRLNDIHVSNPLRAVGYQSYLISNYESSETLLGGISAVPSMHVGTTLMLLFLFWRTRIAREILIAYNLIIYAGSIILGWHYGVDGLVALPVALACWWAAGRIVVWLERRSPEAGKRSA